MTVILFGFQSFAQQIKTDETKKVDRLTALCKLWGKIKYFHPSLAYRADIDWDQALVETIPRVNAAKSPDEYSAALQSMLDVLGDPSTRIVRETPIKTSEGRKLGYKLTEDKILLITAGSYFQLYGAASRRILDEIPKEIPNVRAVVLDLRSDETPGAFGTGALTSSFRQIERLVSAHVVTTPGERSRIYYGYENISPSASGQYKSGLFTHGGKRITPTQNARDIPSVVVLNKNSALLSSTLSLQAAGKALIVFEGDAKEISIGKTDTLEMGNGIVAQVRLSELIYEDGASGQLQPDVIVPSTSDGKDKVIDAAVDLARNFKSSAVVQKKLPGSSFHVPEKTYTQMEYPALEYRLLSVFRLWNTINYFFPYKHLMERDWEDVLREFIPRFEHSKNALEYSLTVAEMVTHLHDSHAYVAGNTLNKNFGSGFPPIRIHMIENTPVVVSSRDEGAAKASGVEIGDIILKVDGEDAKTRLARYAKYISSSTPQDNMDKAAIVFMNGAIDSVVYLTIRDRAGREKEVRLTRRYEDFTTLYHKARSGEILKLLPGNIGYADLDRLDVNQIEEMLEKFKDTKAIIFDMRGYPKGTYWFLAPRLTGKKNVVAALFETPLVGQNTSTSSSEAFNQMIQPAPLGKWIYKGKTVMLIDERSASQAEHTGLFLRAANGTKFIGSHTAGVDGEITTLAVPGAITIGFTGQSVKFPDGKQLQRIGLAPDVLVKPTIKGIRDGRDEVLERAVRYLNSGH